MIPFQPFCGLYDLYPEVDVVVSSEARSYMKRTSLQQGLSALMGIYMVTSGCPVMAKLKPMVRHHLPFATIEETTYRVLSTYLLSQYFIGKRGGEPDWEMKNLLQLYDEIKQVNASVCRRLSSVKSEETAEKRSPPTGSSWTIGTSSSGIVFPPGGGSS